MRPVRFVALSEDGQALVLADEVGRLLTLPIDDRIANLMRADRNATQSAQPADEAGSLAPRDIQARIRAGESAEDVARVLGVPLERVLRYAGPVLQERAMLAAHARRTRLKTSTQGATLAEVVDPRLSQHGVELEKVAWDAYRRDDGTWRIVATWPSGKANATAVWELDKARQSVTPTDDMANYLSGVPVAQSAHRGHGVAPPRPERSGHEPIFPTGTTHPTRDPIRAGREALLASLERPLGSSTRDPAAIGVNPAATSPALAAPAASAAATGEVPRRPRGVRAFYEEAPAPSPDSPAVPSLAVLRPRRSAPDEAGDRPTKRGPAWDEILFGAAPAAKES